MSRPALRIEVERKFRQRIQEKKIAVGHKPDDHEEHQQMGWGGMSM